MPPELGQNPEQQPKEITFAQALKETTTSLNGKLKKILEGLKKPSNQAKLGLLVIVATQLACGLLTDATTSNPNTHTENSGIVAAMTQYPEDPGIPMAATAEASHEKMHATQTAEAETRQKKINSISESTPEPPPEPEAVKNYQQKEFITEENGASISMVLLKTKNNYEIQDLFENYDFFSIVKNNSGEILDITNYESTDFPRIKNPNNVILQVGDRVIFNTSPVILESRFAEEGFIVRLIPHHLNDN